MTDLDFDRTTTCPKGNTYEIISSRNFPGLLLIQNADPKKRAVPDELKGHFTGRPKAEEFLQRYLEDAWAESDKIAEQNAKRASTKKVEKSESAAAAG